MHFMIHTLRIIIFAILISNIVTKPENSSITFHKHIKVNTKKNIYNTTSGNNTHVTIEKSDDQHGTFYKMWPLCLLLIIVFVMLCLLAVWVNTRFECNIQYIERNCLHFSDCLRSLGNINPPGPRPREAADFQDMYEMRNVPVEHRI